MKPAFYYFAGGAVALALSHIGCDWVAVLFGLTAGAVWIAWVSRWTV